VPQEPFLRSRAGRVALLAMLSVDIFVIPVLLTLDVIPMRVGDVVFAATMVVAISAMGTGKGRRLVLAVALAAFVIQFFRFVEKNQLFIVADAALSALAMATFAGMVLVDVFRQEPVADRLLDVILAYLLIGTMFAFVYEAVNVLHPGSLTLDGRDVTPAGYVYFSFTTMTSVGFGDALPMRPVSRAIAMAQALTGQLYVAVLIARFVGARHAAAGRDGGAS
jgi:hypothetical protein